MRPSCSKQNKCHYLLHLNSLRDPNPKLEVHRSEPFGNMKRQRKSISVLVLLFYPILASESVLWSISSLDAYASQRACAQKCFYDRDYAGEYYTNLIASVISCTTPCQESCCCRPDLQSLAESYLSSCVANLCSTDTLDIESAVSLYEGYCTPKYPPATTAQEAATTQTAARPGDSSPQSTILQTSPNTYTPSLTSELIAGPTGSGVQNASGGGGSGLSRSDKIALGTGIGVPLLGIIVSIIIYRLQKKDKTVAISRILRSHASTSRSSARVRHTYV
jgi:hypothetical protein